MFYCLLNVWSEREFHYNMFRLLINTLVIFFVNGVFLYVEIPGLKLESKRYGAKATSELIPERYLVRYLLGGTRRTGGWWDEEGEKEGKGQFEVLPWGVWIEQIIGFDSCVFFGIFPWK